MYVVELLRSWPLRQRLRSGIAEFTRVAPRPTRAPITRRTGPTPMQVLLLGSGLAVGYGVTTRESALDGRLAAELCALTGRGVVVTNQAEQHTRLQDQLLAASVMQSIDLYDLVVWSPSSLEMCSRRLPHSWRGMLGHLLGHAAAGRQVVVLTLPLADGDSPDVVEATRLASRINAELRRAARAFPNVRVVDPPSMPAPALGRPVFTGAYYAALAETVVRALAPGLPVRARQAASV